MASSGGRIAGELEEARLHDGVDPAAHPGLVGDREGIDHPEVDLLVDELALDAAGQVVPDLVRAVRALSRNVAPCLADSRTLVRPSIPNWWQATKSAPLDEIGRSDGLGPEAQVRHRDRARLLRVVDEVALGEQVGALADDLDRGLVGTDRAVRAEPEEDGLDLACRARANRKAPSIGRLRCVTSS